MARFEHSQDTTVSADAGEIENLERCVIDTCAEILNLKKVGPDDDFFELGGTSFQLMLILGELQGKLGFQLDQLISAPHRYRTPRELAAFLQHSMQSARASAS